MTALSTWAGEIQIVPLMPAHGVAAARLHISGQPGTFLTALGPDVLTVFYQVLPTSPVGFGFAALDRARIPRAYAAVTTSIGRLFFEMGTRRLPALLPPLLNRFVQQPALIGRSLQTAIYPFVTGRSVAKKDDKDENTAELLAIMADPAWRRQGLGSSLLEQIVNVCHSRAIAHLDVTVDAANTGARHFYEHHGFVFRRQVRLYGRPMVLYRMRVQP